MLFFLAGHALAQTDGQFVIKINGHYLSHEGNTLQDAATFSPDCLWTSDNHYTNGGANKNYYYMDGNTPRFLAAPNFEANGELTLSTTMPTTSALGNPESPYYFYRWDGGLGRGIQYFGVTNENECEHGWDPDVNQCWEVYWVSYNANSNTWELSEEHYNLSDVPTGGKYYAVDVTEHAQDTLPQSGGLGNLTVPAEMVWGGNAVSLSASMSTPYQYKLRPAYTTYVFEGGTHNYYGGEDHLTGTPGLSNNIEATNPSYHWTLSGEGAQFLSLSNGNTASPTLSYTTQNTTGHKTATITLTVTYQNGERQTSTAQVVVKTPCQNPVQAAAPVVTFVGVTVSWVPTAEEYTVSWGTSNDQTTWSSVTVGNVTSYTITGLEYETPYHYKVQTSCDQTTPRVYDFTTKEEPGLMIAGNIFGGGRMADVGTESSGGNTEIVIINCDSVGGIFGGNDIAGVVHGANGSKITLGVNANDPNGYDEDYAVTPANVNLKFGSVYGGGNGFYGYNGAPIIQAAWNTTYDVDNGNTINDETGEAVWTNTTGATQTFVLPTITRSNIMVTDNYVQIDSLFGGAKNARLSRGSENEVLEDVLITINGGTIAAVFGGNNYGGDLGYHGHENIVVNKTTVKTTLDDYNSSNYVMGRDFGIGFLFGGGNKAYGQHARITINGGQIDNVFGGGNSADLRSTQVIVNCPFGSGSDVTYGSAYSAAVTSYTEDNLTLDDNYDWNCTGIYNIRNLFGGNNQATMQGVPTITLTEGSVGTVYGGGNAGDMWADSQGSITFDQSYNLDNFSFKYSTFVEMDSPKILVDYLYGGCNKSNVLYSTWVSLKNGHVGTVYGGCNISGDVGSTLVNGSAPLVPQVMADQEVYGATYVEASSHITVHNNLFGGSNGYYNCSTDGITYNNDTYFDDPEGQYAGLTVPTHNVTHAIIKDGALIKGDVYAGGNLACVGFDDETGRFRDFPELLGLASVRMVGGTVEQNVYGGGNMASIFGINEVRVLGGTIEKALYGGNDRAGQVAEKTNRILPQNYTIASDGATSLTTLGVKTYVDVSGNAQIGTVYGGGNGDYPPGSVQYCHGNDDEPIQSHTFVDVHINGGEHGGKINTVYGGGNGVTVRHGVTVFVNINEPNEPEDFDNVDVVFGGNNKGNLDVVPDIRLFHGQVGTVYGGCNQGAMAATGNNLKTIGGYEDIGSYVYLRQKYDPTAPNASSSSGTTVTAKVTNAIYGGCRMNGVTNNSLVLVEGGDFSTMTGGIFGGSDISGTVSGDSRVAVTGGTVGKVYGGGNGYYTYNNNGDVYTIPTSGNPVLVATGITAAPICTTSGADILGGLVGTSALLGAGTVSQVFGGGYGKDTQTTGNVTVNIGNIAPSSSSAIPTIYGDIYGGSAFGTVNTNASNSTTVNFFNGVLKKAEVNDVRYGGNLYGGGLGRQAADAVTDPNTGEIITPAVDPIAARVNGKVFVNISSSTQSADNCFIDLREANIFGCNNANGSPQDEVTVHVWKTGFTTGDYESQEGNLYAIDQVFGGGNRADYAPENGLTNSRKRTLVYVHECLNTIRRVFSGGNAAAATGVSAIIEGGRFDYIFGGGNGEVDPANIGSGGTNLTLSAGIVNHLFGGSNLQGQVTGPVITDINGDNVGSACGEEIAEFFGGSNEATLNADVYTLIECGSGLIGDMYGGSNKANITGNVRLDVRGGSFTNVYGGSKGVVGDSQTEPVSADINGNVTLNLEGGTIVNAFGGSNNKGNITGKITVNVIDYELDHCELDLTNVYGGGNLASYTPTDPSEDGSVVNVMHIKRNGTVMVQGVKGNVFGGGNQAEVIANTKVNIGYDATSMSGYLPDDLSTASHNPNPANFHAYVTGNVYGGGSQAGITGSTYVNVYNGEVCQNIATGAQSVGIYGGCNTSGVVTGSTNVDILGGTIGRKGVYNNSTGTVSNSTKANIHGGGFGAGTDVNGNVNVTFGSLAADSSLVSPRLYGDLYGGSALGNVNATNSQKTTVNINNGQISGVLKSYNSITEVETYEEGNVFGGGLGSEQHAAMVRGEVQVNVGYYGTYPSCDLTGKATLRYCNVFGCNNVNGSPQYDVHVDIYRTAQVPGETTLTGEDYAILTTFGGGNFADYAPQNWVQNTPFRTYVYVHGCNNTIKYVYGGGNAADAVAVQTLIEGGRFDEIYGGGNGLIAPANIGMGGVGFNVNGGHVNYVYEGSNKNGTIAAPSLDPTPNFPAGCIGDCGELVIDSYYFGDNEAEHFGDLENVITCEQAEAFQYKYVYAGSRWAILYGDIKLTVQGGNIQYLFGGSKGYIRDNIPADVRRFPSYTELDDDLSHPISERKYSAALQEYMRDTVNHPERKALVGQGGNIVLIVQGGTIGDLVGGCDELGNVEGKITVIVDDCDCDCRLHIGNVYGANNETYYAPINDATHHAYYEPNTSNADPVPTPKVHILHGTIGWDSTLFQTSQEWHPMEGNVYGGGKLGNITSNPIVVVGESSETKSVEIRGNVLGGGKLGAVDGNSKVLVVPQKHTLTITQPTNSEGEIILTDRGNNTISSGTQVDEYADLYLKAISSVYGWKLDKWQLTNGSVLFEKSVNTMFTMGTADATIAANFVSVPKHTFTSAVVSVGTGTGTVAVTDGFGQPLTSNQIGEGAVLNLEATTTGNNAFLKWTETEGNGSVANVNEPVTTFTMGTTNCTVKATFVPTHNVTITQPSSGGTFKVYDVHGTLLTPDTPTAGQVTNVQVGETATLVLVATSATNYHFGQWSVTNGTVAEGNSTFTSFTMGAGDATITAIFEAD